MIRLLSLIAAATLAIAGMTLSPLQAHADDQYLASVLETSEIESLNVHSGPGTEYDTTWSIPTGSDLLIGCWTEGTPVTGSYGTTTIWYSTPQYPGGWVTDAGIWTGSNEPVTGRCDSSITPSQPTDSFVITDENLLDTIITDPWVVIREIAYDRTVAVDWAREHAYDTGRYENDCTWFVSQALWAGGMPKTEEWTDWSMDWSNLTSRLDFPGPVKTATLADSFTNYMITGGWADFYIIDWSDNTASGARVGDVIAYDWDGDGVINHVSLVSSLNADGYPNITQHSPAASDRYWSWSATKKDWIQNVHKNSKAYLIKIKL